MVGCDHEGFFDFVKSLDLFITFDYEDSMYGRGAVQTGAFGEIKVAPETQVGSAKAIWGIYLAYIPDQTSKVHSRPGGICIIT